MTRNLFLVLGGLVGDTKLRSTRRIRIRVNPAAGSPLRPCTGLPLLDSARI
jgi:hypothetical protein